MDPEVFTDGDLGEPYKVDKNNKGNIRITTAAGRMFNVSKSIDEKNT